MEKPVAGEIRGKHTSVPWKYASETVACTQFQKFFFKYSISRESRWIKSCACWKRRDWPAPFFLWGSAKANLRRIRDCVPRLDIGTPVMPAHLQMQEFHPSWTGKNETSWVSIYFLGEYHKYLCIFMYIYIYHKYHKIPLIYHKCKNLIYVSTQFTPLSRTRAAPQETSGAGLTRLRGTCTSWSSFASCTSVSTRSRWYSSRPLSPRGMVMVPSNSHDPLVVSCCNVVSSGIPKVYPSPPQEFVNQLPFLQGTFGCFSARMAVPIGSMYAIYANIGGILMVNVTIYSIHGSYGVWLIGASLFVNERQPSPLWMTVWGRWMSAWLRCWVWKMRMRWGPPGHGSWYPYITLGWME